MTAFACPKFEKSLGFEIRNSQFFWTGESSLTAETMLSSLRNETGGEKVERNEAVAFLREVLNSGEREAKEVEKEADKSFGITTKQLRTARNKLDVQWRREGFGKESKIFWRLPNIDAHIDTVDDCMNETGHLLVNKNDKMTYSNDLHIDAPFPNNGHLWKGKKPVCSKCGLEMETTKDKTELFCTFGCGSRKAES